jgi:hypothetical protein
MVNISRREHVVAQKGEEREKRKKNPEVQKEEGDARGSRSQS